MAQSAKKEVEVSQEHQLVGQMASKLFDTKTLGVAQSHQVAAAFVASLGFQNDGEEEYTDELMDNIHNSCAQIFDFKKARVPYDDTSDLVKALAALVETGFITHNDGYYATTDKAAKLVSYQTQSYPPTTGNIERRFNYGKNPVSHMVKKAIHILESVPYTVCAPVVKWAEEVAKVIGDEEGYILRGCQEMNPKLAYFSEFKACARFRLYQAACAGPNGQGSDRSRALQDLHGVPQDYIIDNMIATMQKEMEDMTKDVVASSAEMAKLGAVKFIIKHETDPKSEVKKPWNFAKCYYLMEELLKGNRPYVGVAFGMDAKCSGPQYAALITGDVMMAMACGFTTNEELDDAYEKCCIELKKFGFVFSRALIKTPFMAIFYGAGWRAFTDSKSILKEDDGQELLDAIYGKGSPINDELAERFHKAVTNRS